MTNGVTLRKGEHPVPRDAVSPEASAVVERLAQCGHEAYLVGGAVRDFFLGRTPKDFDVVTDAWPDEIMRMFPGSQSVGHRFRIVHVAVQTDDGVRTVETATFRASPDSPAGGYQRDDNTFGTLATDAGRRDFTVNGLYYDPQTETVLDPVGGVRDIRAGRIRCIGESNARFREDPVRMIRAVRFAARFGFDLAPETRQGVAACRARLANVCPRRLGMEMLGCFRHGCTAAVFRALRDGGLLAELTPPLSAYLDAAGTGPFYRLLDAFDAQRDAVKQAPAVCLAVLLALPFRDDPRTREENLKQRLLKRVVHDALGERVQFVDLSLSKVASRIRGIRFFDRPADHPKSERFIGGPAFGEAVALTRTLVAAGVVPAPRHFEVYEAVYERDLAVAGPRPGGFDGVRLFSQILTSELERQ
jgi:poly(A) polymerase